MPSFLPVECPWNVMHLQSFCPPSVFLVSLPWPRRNWTVRSLRGLILPGRGGLLSAFPATRCSIVYTGLVHAHLASRHHSTVVFASFCLQRGLNAEKEAKTLQSAEDLAAVFIPGKPFAFDAEITLMDGPAESPVEGSADGATTPQAVAADA